jgi:hypothetical protein
LENLRFGVFQARRAGLTRADVWNAQEFAAFEEWRRGPRRRADAPAPKASPPVAVPLPAKAKPANAERAVPKARAKSGAAPAKPATGGRETKSSAKPRAAKSTRGKG